jgi:hypothetical protein
MAKQIAELVRSRLQRVTVPGIIGFCAPFALLILLALIFHHPVAPATTASTTTGDKTAASATTSAGPLPTSDEVAAANQAILSYCTNDLRQGTNCTLISNSNVTAPGFVESGVRMSGYFEGNSSTTDGSALAKGSGSSWQVIWVGQGCIPKNVAQQNDVAASLDVCAS